MMKRNWFLLLTITLLLNSAHAELIQGIISIKGDSCLLSSNKNHYVYKIVPANPQVGQDLKRLQDKDLLIGNGTYNYRDQTVSLNSIDYVGLKRLLGTWRAKTHETFQFVDYWNLKVLIQLIDEAQPEQELSLEYRVSPNSGASWSIFLTDGKKAMLGGLEMNSDQMQIKVFNTNSGEVEKNIVFDRM